MDPKLQAPTHPGRIKSQDDFPREFCAGKVCAEIGVAQGSYSMFILQHAPAQLHLIDCWKNQPQTFYPGDDANRPQDDNENTYNHVLRTFLHLPGVAIKRAFSFDAAQEYPDKFFDFVFIDAVNTMPMALADCVAWWPKVKPGGILAGHDYNLGELPGCPALQVAEALKHFLYLIHREKLDFVPEQQDSWAIRK